MDETQEVVVFNQTDILKLAIAVNNDQCRHILTGVVEKTTHPEVAKCLRAFLREEEPVAAKTTKYYLKRFNRVWKKEYFGEVFESKPVSKEEYIQASMEISGQNREEVERDLKVMNEAMSERKGSPVEGTYKLVQM